MRRTIALLLLTITAATAMAQDVVVSNIGLWEEDGLVTICYDLQAPKPMEVVLEVVADEFVLQPETISGDIGIMIAPGQEKCIFWEVLEDYPEGLAQYNVSIDVQARPYESLGAVESGSGSGAASSRKPTAGKNCIRQARSDTSLFSVTRRRLWEAQDELKACQSRMAFGFVSEKDKACGKKAMKKLRDKVSKYKRSLDSRIEQYCAEQEKANQ